MSKVFTADKSSWLEASLTSEGLRLKASRNNTGKVRSGTVFLGGIDYDGESVMVNVTQAAIYNPGATFYTVSGVPFSMIRVEGGSFTMGKRNEYYEEINKEVTLNSFYIGETEVTQALWYAVMGQKPTANAEYQWISTYGLGDNYPVYYVEWDDCQSFISKLNQLTGQKFRLPTEEEWVFAARGGNKSKGYKYAGSDNPNDVAWYKSNSTHIVATKQPNELGLYDMSGNVSELCSDWYTSNSHVVRGGDWFYTDYFCDTSKCYGFNVGAKDYRTGFRLAMD